MIQLLQNSTIHGVGHIVSTRSKIWKIFWYLLLICGIIGIFINIVFVFIKYFSHPIIWSYTPEHEPFLWPPVTVCYPREPIRFKDNSPQLKYWRDTLGRTEQYKNESKRRFMYKEEIITVYSLFSVDMDKLLTTWNFESFLSVRYQYGNMRSDIFQREPVKYLNESLRYYKQFVSPQMIDIGYSVPCYTIHLQEVQSLDPQPIKSIYFDIKLNDREHETFNSTRFPRAVYLYVTRQNHIPQKKNEIILYPGTKTVFTVSQTRHQFNKDCRQTNFTVELYDALLQGTRFMEGCDEDCIDIYKQKLVVEHCNCYRPYYPMYKNKTGFPQNCYNSTIFSKDEFDENMKCLQNFLNNQTYSRVRDQYLENCRGYKVRKCNSVSYRMDQRTNIDIDAWSTALEEKVEKKIRKLLNISNNERSVNINSRYMSNNDVHFVLTRESLFGDFYKEENEYPFSQLLSDVGGLMGLWLGMSVVGLFEIVVMMYKYMMKKIRKMRWKNDDPANS